VEGGHLNSFVMAHLTMAFSGV